VVFPFYKYDFLDILTKNTPVETPFKKAYVFAPDLKYDEHQHEYLTKLMENIEVESPYDGLYSIHQLQSGYYRKYKFIIAFENVIDTDYVTEKFYEPLIKGSVPIYLGAPNIDDFAPGDNCFVDVRKFENPKSLADFIKACYDDEQLYAQFFEWKNKPLRQSFVQKIEEQKEHPLVRLCRKVAEISVIFKNPDPPL